MLKLFIKNLKVVSLFAVVFTTSQLNAQVNYKVIDQMNTFKKLSIRPYMSFGIAPLDLGDLAANLNIEGQYWVSNKLDVRGGINMGTFTGITVGGTMHLKDAIQNKSQKYITSESYSGNTKTTKYFKGNADIRKVFGPAADLKIGYFNKNTKVFYTQLDFGVDFQSFARNYAELNDGSTYPSNKNGWTSLKVQGVIATSFKKVAIGAMATLQASRRPWKGVTMYLNIPLGFMKTIGGEVIPIISPGFGVSINIIQVKQ